MSSDSNLEQPTSSIAIASRRLRPDRQLQTNWQLQSDGQLQTPKDNFNPAGFNPAGNFRAPDKKLSKKWRSRLGAPLSVDRVVSRQLRSTAFPAAGLAAILQPRRSSSCGMPTNRELPPRWRLQRCFQPLRRRCCRTRHPGSEHRCERS